MNKVLLFLAFVSLFQVSCQSTETMVDAVSKFKRNIFGSNEKPQIIGIHIKDAREILGEPMGITKMDEKNEAWYYAKTFVVFRDDVVAFVDDYSGPFYEISTVSFAGEIPKKKRVAVVSGIANVPTEDLEFKSRTRPLKHMLQMRGYDVIDPSGRPDYVAVVKYGISEPMVEYRTWSTPVYNWVPGQTITTTLSSYGRTSTITSSSVGSLEYSGERIQTEKLTSFRRYLVIEVVDYNAAKKGTLKQLWKIESNSIGGSSDIDRILLGMYAGTSFLWERTSRGQKTGVIANNDPMINYLRTLL